MPPINCQTTFDVDIIQYKTTNFKIYTNFKDLKSTFSYKLHFLYKFHLTFHLSLFITLFFLNKLILNVTKYYFYKEYFPITIKLKGVLF